MRYLADLLTVARLTLCIVLLVLAFIGAEPEVAFIIFIIGELTDAFDGAAATKWPFPKNQTPKYRKYAAKYDMFIDIFLGLSMIFYFILRVNLVAGLIICFGFTSLAAIVDLIVYGKILGHPDDCKAHSLIKRNFPLAKKIILARRMLYLSLIALVAAWTFYASGWSLIVKIVITVISIIISLFLWLFLAQRRKNISRDAVDAEQQLMKTARK